MAEEAYEATKIEKGKGLSEESEVDALIAGALAELGTAPKSEKPEKELKATPIPVTPKEKIEPKVEPKPAILPVLKVRPEGAVFQKPQAPPQEKMMAKEKEPAYEETFRKFQVGSVVKGPVVRVDSSGAFIDIAYKSDGFIAREELDQDVKVGDQIEAVIEKLESKDGYVVLSKEKADYEFAWKNANDAYRSRKTLSAKVISAVNGGLVAECEGMRGFIPASQIVKKPEQQMKDFVGAIIPVKVIEANRRQGKIILSHKLGTIDAERQKTVKSFDGLEVGQVRHGKVTSLKNFGAFVDIDGIEGLIHLSELSWKRVKHPSEVVKAGQEIDVFILGVDKINRKLSLGLKELQSDPWATVNEKYKPGQVVKVKILRLAKFGAFAEIDEGLEGLIHISELSLNKINTPDEAVKPGDLVEAKILRIIPEEQRIGLSIREVALDKERADHEAQKKDENKVTIGTIIAEKERQKAEKEAEITEEEIVEEGVQDEGLT
ncbi:MAG: S1 RNA-binding domain-containing protein [Candidatus Margulisiibacteriota bacterium]